MKTLQASFFSLMSLHFKWYSRLSFCYTGLCTEPSTKEERLLDSLVAIKLPPLDSLIASFVEQFKGRPRKY